jgi:L,D-peptidoglycan transpeptidase YkuD (ErfK/YbiS/YcfS/YnhG family)
MKDAIKSLRVCVTNASASKGRIVIGHRSIPCLIGRNGLAALKSEGDGKSPRGTFSLVQLLLRRDRWPRVQTHLPQRGLTRQDGWCDAPGHPLYNRKVRLPFAASHEVLWRVDSAYDALVILGYNTHPRRQGAGSAIFLHIAALGSTGTQGCIAVARGDMRKVLAVCNRSTTVSLGGRR